MTGPNLSPCPALPALFAATPAATKRFWQFFTTQISNDHTRKATFMSSATLPTGATMPCTAG
jgi:hypothetical protein